MCGSLERERRCRVGLEEEMRPDLWDLSVVDGSVDFMVRPLGAIEGY